MRVRRHVARVRLQRQSADTVQCRSVRVQIDSVELNQPHAHHVMRQMQQQAGSTELDDGERCDCGLPVEKSTLPRGWSIHLSQDPQTLGEVRPTPVSSYYQALHNANKSGFSFMRQLITRHCSHLCAAHTHPLINPLSGTRNVKPIWILLKQETVSGSRISWAYASLHLAPDGTDNHINTPPLNFLQAGCPSCRPTNSVKALMDISWPSGTQQQTRRRGVRRSAHAGTDRRTDTVPLHRPCSAYVQSRVYNGL